MENSACFILCEEPDMLDKLHDTQLAVKMKKRVHVNGALSLQDHSYAVTISRHIEFIKVDPGTQQIGSFHPLGGEWCRTAYKKQVLLGPSAQEAKMHQQLTVPQVLKCPVNTDQQPTDRPVTQQITAPQPSQQHHITEEDENALASDPILVVKLHEAAGVKAGDISQQASMLTVDSAATTWTKISNNIKKLPPYGTTLNQSIQKEAPAATNLEAASGASSAARPQTEPAELTAGRKTSDYVGPYLTGGSTFDASNPTDEVSALETSGRFAQATSMVAEGALPVCKYGASCYRSTNKTHLAHFSHPTLETVKGGRSAVEEKPVEKEGINANEVLVATPEGAFGCDGVTEGINRNETSGIAVDSTERPGKRTMVMLEVAEGKSSAGTREVDSAQFRARIWCGFSLCELLGWFATQVYSKFK